MMRIGMGYDVHRLVPERPLVLGGVTIAYDLGLLGHSDADVLLHAVMDALLGAAGAGDIGRHFPDTDEAYRGANSRMLLRQVGNIIAISGYRLGNIDATICAQAPKLAPHIPQMQAHIAEDLGVAVSQINIKATTTEELGFVGQKQGLAAYAVALLLSNVDES